MRQKQYIVMAILTVLYTAGGLFAMPKPAKANASHKDTADMRWWKHDRFGMFVHWGLYSVAAGYWNGKPISGQSAMVESTAHVPRAQWAKLAGHFDPIEFNATKWVKLAKAAGMKYLVFTCKHHGGFSMFRTSATPYNIVDATPWHKDPCALLAKACREQGIRFCAYYSIMDWHTPYQTTLDYNPLHPTYTFQNMIFVPGGAKHYIHYMEKQLREIITQYHPSLLWFDDPTVRPWKRQYAKDVFDFVRHLDPAIILDDRLDKFLPFKGYGDYQTPEGYIPAQGLPGAWETCMTITDTWGYKRQRADNRCKSVRTLVRGLIKCASGGGNFLLDVGPNAKGVIPQPQVNRLLAVGKWLKVNGEAIYGTHRSPFKTVLPFGYATTKPGLIYLEVTHWPRNGKLLIPMHNRIERAYLLTDPAKELMTSTSKKGQIVHVPTPMPDPIAEVVVLKIHSQAVPAGQ